jgi:membrane protein
MLMSRIKSGSGKGSSLGAWDVAAALGLVAVAFIVDRTAPADNAKPALPPMDGRHASTAGLASEDGNQGRDAASPADIPAKGWKDILWRVYGNVSDHRILALAAGMTYYSILAIFPALAALVAIYGLFTEPASIAKHLDEVSGFIPGGAAEVAREQLTRVASKGGSTLGFTFAMGLIISLWSANAAMKALFDTLNIVYGEQEKRASSNLTRCHWGSPSRGSHLSYPRWPRSSSFPSSWNT